MRTLLSFACLLIALVLPAGASAVVGGKAVQTGSYPFVVSVGDASGPKCGGTLIAANVVLTAAGYARGPPVRSAGQQSSGSNSRPQS